MSTLSVTTISTANGTTNLTLTTGNTSGPAIVVGANGSFTYSNVSSFSVGSNVVVNTSAIFVGNSTVNTTVSNGNLIINGNNVSPVQSFRNKFINGNFDHWQRGTSNTSIANGQYLADRWTNSRVGTTANISRQSFTLGQTDVPGEPTYFQRTVTTSSAGAGNYFLLSQPVESVRTLAGQTATLSFWAKADASKNIAVEFPQNFGTGGSPSTQVNTFGATCALTTSWQKFTVTVNIPSISGKTLGSDNNDFLGIYFWFDAGSNFNSRTNSLGQQSGTFDIAQVQLEAGSVATPFEIRPLGVELSLCQRYYQRIPVNAYATSSTFSSYSPDYYYPMTLINQMRATPTYSRINISDSGVSSGIASGTSSGFSVIMELTSAYGQTTFTAVADAEL